MSVEFARAVADTALADRRRWRSGALVPADAAGAEPGQTSCAQAECVMEGGDGFTLEVTLRFRQVEVRTVHRLLPGVDDLRPVGSLEVDGRPVLSGDDALEHEVTYVVDHRTISGTGSRHTVRIAGGVDRDPIRDATGELVGEVVRERRGLRAVLGVTVYPVEGTPDAARIRVWVENRTEPDPAAGLDVLPSAMLAVHLIIAARDAAFVSLATPPDWAIAAVESCANVGLWPVLTGPPGRRDVLLAAPVTLGDHPELPAPTAPRRDPAATVTPPAVPHQRQA
jgi:hypothetical protein